MVVLGGWAVSYERGTPVGQHMILDVQGAVLALVVRQYKTKIFRVAFPGPSIGQPWLWAEAGLLPTYNY